MLKETAANAKSYENLDGNHWSYGNVRFNGRRLAPPTKLAAHLEKDFLSPMALCPKLGNESLESGELRPLTRAVDLSKRAHVHRPEENRRAFHLQIC